MLTPRHSKTRQNVSAGLLMERPAELEAQALQLENEAVDFELLGRNAAALAKLQQAKSLRDQATALRQSPGWIHMSSIQPRDVLKNASFVSDLMCKI